MGKKKKSAGRKSKGGGKKTGKGATKKKIFKVVPPFQPIVSTFKPRCNCMKLLMSNQPREDCLFEHRKDTFLLNLALAVSPRINQDIARKRFLDSFTTRNSSVINSYPYTFNDKLDVKSPLSKSKSTGVLDTTSQLSDFFNNKANNSGETIKSLLPSISSPDIHPSWPSTTPETKLKRCRIEKMIRDYTLLLSRQEEWNEDQSEGLVRRSSLLAALGRHESALLDAEACLRIRPSYVAAYYRKGIALASLGKYVEASTSFKVGLRYAPMNKILRSAFDSSIDRSRWSAGD